MRPEIASLANAALLLAPPGIWIFIFLRGRFRTEYHAGAFLGCLWLFLAALIVDQFCVRANIIRFSETTATMYRVPVGFVLGQAILFGPLAFYATRRLHPAAVALIGLAALRAVYSPVFGCFGSPLPVTAIFWLGMIPALALAKWTVYDMHLYVRSTLQAILWAVILLWLFPSMLFQQTGHGWTPLLTRPPLETAACLIPLAIPAFLLIGALRQFAVEGLGTGFPYDPPRRLVTHGVYAYLSNPMQLGICLMMGWWGVVIASWQISTSALVALFLFIVFKDICNGSCAIGETDPLWAVYQREVPKWIPRRTPWRRDAT